MSEFDLILRGGRVLSSVFDGVADVAVKDGRVQAIGDINGAEKIELQAKGLGFNTEITPRMNEGTVYFVDIALPPGRGAGAIIEQYGEDKVKLRDAATCPQGR